MIHIMNKKKLSWKIKATFEGKMFPREYITPDIRSNNPGWMDEVFNRVIEKIEFFIPTGHRLVMKGFEKYNFFIEALQVFGTEAASTQAIWFCGKLPKKDVVDLWVIRDGKMLHYEEAWRHEYLGAPTSGWKMGVSGVAHSGIVI